MSATLINRQVRRELEVELDDGSMGTEVLIGTIVSYSQDTTYFEVDYHDGGELEEFTHDELLEMLIPTQADSDPGPPPDAPEPMEPAAAADAPPQAAVPSQIEDDSQPPAPPATHIPATPLPEVPPALHAAYQAGYDSSSRDPEESFLSGGISLSAWRQPPPAPRSAQVPPSEPPPGADGSMELSLQGLNGGIPTIASTPAPSTTQGEPSVLSLTETMSNVSPEERLVGRKIRTTVRRVVETPQGPGPEEEFEMVGHVIYYDVTQNTFTCEFEDGGEGTFTPEELERVMMPDEMSCIEEELRREREAIHAEKEKAKWEEEQVEQGRLGTVQAQAAEMEMRAAEREREVKEAQQALDKEMEERDEAFLLEKAKRDQEALDELQQESVQKEKAGLAATQQMQKEMQLLQHLIAEATSTAVAMKKDKMVVKKEIAEFVKQQTKLQERLSDDEKAIMQMARQMDERLRAQVRDIRRQAEEGIASIRRQTEDEIEQIRRLHIDREEEYDKEMQASMELMRNTQMDSHQVLHNEIKAQVRDKDIAERDMLALNAELATISEAHKAQQSSKKKELDMLMKMRVELEEERTKANEHTLEKIRITQRQVARTKEAQARIVNRRTTAKAEIEACAKKMVDFSESMQTTVAGYQENFEKELRILHGDFVNVNKRIKEDVKLLNSTIEQDIVELRAVLGQQTNKSQTCIIA